MAVRRARPLALAAVVALVLAAIVVFVIVSGDDDYRAVAVFDEAFGLVQTGEVKSGGVTVGQIEEVSLGEDGLPHVTMVFDDGFRLNEGATADVALFSLVGQLNRFISIEQGDGPPLEDGAVLGVARNERPLEFDELLSTFSPKTRRQVGIAIEGLQRATEGTGPDFQRTLRHSGEALEETAALLGAVNAEGDAVRTLVADGRLVIESLASDPSELQAAADELAPVLETTAERQVELAASLELLPPGLRSFRGTLTELDLSIDDLRRLVDLAEPAVAELEPFSTDLRPALAAADPALKEAADFLRSASEDLPGLASLLRAPGAIATDLDSALTLLNPILDDVRVRTPEVAGFLTLLGDSAANYDRGGHGIRISGILSDVPDNSVGPSDSGAGCLARPFERTPGVLEGAPWEDYTDSFIGGGRPFPEPQGSGC